MELVEFLLARIGEDEAAARDALAGPWRDTGPVLAGVIDDHHTTVAVCNSTHWEGGEYTYPATKVEEANARHIARWDPARVLAESAAKRRIVEEVLRRMEAVEGDYAGEFGITDWVPPSEELLHLLALPYADHSDYPEATQ